MKNRPIFRAIWFTTNSLLALSFAALLYGAGWEYSTRCYLKGFADAVVPVNAAPEEKIESILEWMRNGPRRASAPDFSTLPTRDPQATLNYKQLLNVCGTATNAFLNLAVSTDLQVRRLLLLTPARDTKHVVAEVLVDGRWIVVDPSFHILFRDSHGRLLTRQDLRVPAVLSEVTRDIPRYSPDYTYENIAHLRLKRIPFAGGAIRRALEFFYPSWEEAFNWSLLVERRSFALLTFSSALFFFLLLVRTVLAWYGDHRLGLPRVRLREHLVRAGMALLSSPR